MRARHKRTVWRCKSNKRLRRDPHAGDLYVFRGKRGHLIKILWHDGIGMSLMPSGWSAAGFYGRRRPTGRRVGAAQLAYMLDG